MFWCSSSVVDLFRYSDLVRCQVKSTKLNTPAQNFEIFKVKREWKMLFVEIISGFLFAVE